MNAIPPSHKRCPEKRAHYAHEWYNPLRIQCPGGPDETSVGLCWQDSGYDGPGNYRLRCELRAGHPGAHECDRGNWGGTATWGDGRPNNVCCQIAADCLAEHDVTIPPHDRRATDRRSLTVSDTTAQHSVTIECEEKAFWPTLKFTCQAPPDADCRTICPNSECEEGCYHPGEPGHEREPVDYCNTVTWFEEGDDVAQDVFGGRPTSITAPVLISWENGEMGPMWRFAHDTPAPTEQTNERTEQ